MAQAQGNIIPFIRNPDGGYGPAQGFTEAAPTIGGQYAPTYKGPGNQMYDLYTDKGKFDASNAWAAASPTAYLVPQGQNPQGDTPLGFINKYRDIGSLGNMQAGKSIYDMSASGGTVPYDPSKGRQVDTTGGGPVDIGKPATDQTASDIGNPEVPFFLWKSGQSGAASGQASPASDTTPNGSNIPGGFKNTQHASDTIASVSTTVDGLGVDTKGKTISDIIQAALNPQPSDTTTTPSGASAPASPDLNPPGLPNPDLGPAPQFDKYQDEMMLRGTYGIDSMTSQIESIDTQLASIKADEQAKYAKIATDTVSSSVRSKEMAAVNASVKGQTAALSAQRTLLTKQLSVANKAVSMIVARDSSEYSAAKATYTKELNANLKYISQFDAGTTPQQKHDKASLLVMLNSLSKGKMTFDSLSQDQQNTMESLVASVYGPEFAGVWNDLPSGTATVYSKTITGANGKKYLQSLNINKDGSLNVTYTTPVGKTPSGLPTTAQKLQMSNTTESYFQSIVDPSTGFIDGNQYMSYRQSWQDHGGDLTTFDSKFHHFLDPNDPILRTSGIGSQSQKSNNPAQATSTPSFWSSIGL